MGLPLPRIGTVLLVVLGGLLLAAILIPTGVSCGPSKETAVTRSRLSEIVTACYIYRQEYGDFPAVSDESSLWRVLGGDNPRHLRFISPPNGTAETFLDGWERALRARRRAGVLELRSSGKDGITFTEDDWLVLFDDRSLRRGVHQARENHQAARLASSASDR